MSAPLVTARQRVTQRTRAEQSMMDMCIRLVFTTVRDADNQEKEEDWITAETFPCGFQAAITTRAGQRTSRESPSDIVTTLHLLRLPLAATVFTSRDRVRITHRQGVVLTPPLDYAIQGDPLVGPTAIQVVLSGTHS